MPWRQPRKIGVEGENHRRKRVSKPSSDLFSETVTGHPYRPASRLRIEQEPSELPLFLRERLPSREALPWEVPFALDEFPLPVYVRIDQPQLKIKAWWVLRPQVAPKRIAGWLGSERRNNNQRADGDLLERTHERLTNLDPGCRV